MKKFDFSWFIPAVIKYRAMFGEVLVASIFLQFIALASPLFFQVVTDKVLVHRTLNTLDVLDAEVRYLDALRELDQSRYAFLSADMKLRYAACTLTHEDIQRMTRYFSSRSVREKNTEVAQRSVRQH